jgi:hypothetical protein
MNKTYNFLDRTIHNNFCLARFILAYKLKPEIYNKYLTITNMAENASEYLLITLMMEAARTSETLVNFYQITQRYNPEDSHLRTHRW